ncbi:MAG: hypothetical protein U0136_09935 [Bdellovibrionota bacterium]
MRRICELTGRAFELTPAEQEFLITRDLPLPRLCPEERLRRRLSFRNQRQLFRRACSVTGKSLISVYPPEYHGPVVSLAYWHSDECDGHLAGRSFDFSRPFFEQFGELLTSVPLPSCMVTKSENCEYNAYCAQSRNCYLCQSSVDTENACYVYGPTRCRDSMECHTIDGSELCYEVVHGTNCYDVQESKNVVHCQESAFLLNCRNCRNCFFCVNLRGAQYCFRNEQLDRESYFEAIRPYQRMDHAMRRELRRSFAELSSRFPSPALWGSMNEDVSGNYIFNSKAVSSSFDILDCEDVSHGYRLRTVKTSADASFVYHGEELYEYTSGNGPTRCRFSYALYDGAYDADYSANCAGGCHDIFGCVGLRRADHCIFNASYTKHDYGITKARIIAHMKETGEWGEFFPAALSPFAYNDTVAHDLLPLTRQDAERRGFRWLDRSDEERRQLATRRQPIEFGGSSSALNETYTCSTCSKPYRLQPLELQLAGKLSAPLAIECFDCRYRTRLERLEPLSLVRRTCTRCEASILTPIGESRPEPVYCENCYQASL